jgi:hypothetical protein
MKVSVERQAPAGLHTVAVCAQIILFVTQRSYSIVRQSTSPAVASYSGLYLWCGSPSTFRILMEKSCVLSEVGTTMLYALYTDVGLSHADVPTYLLTYLLHGAESFLKS